MDVYPQKELPFTLIRITIETKTDVTTQIPADTHLSFLRPILSTKIKAGNTAMKLKTMIAVVPSHLPLSEMIPASDSMLEL